MDLAALTELVARGESEQLEFKRSTGQRSEAAKTVCAMLNGRFPSHVLFGVGDRGEIIGQEVTARTIEDIVHELRRIDPPASARVDIGHVPLANGRTVIALTVSPE